MRTFQGWYLEAKSYITLGDVPRSQDPATVSGSTLVRYDLVQTKKSEYKNGVVVETDTTIIDTDTNLNIKKDDRIFVGKWLKVDSVEYIVPKEKEKIVRLWPNRLLSVAIKRVYLK